MGQKIHPTGYRIGCIEPWRSRWHGGKRDFARLLLQDKIIAPMRELQETEMANMRTVLQSLGTGREALDTKREEAKQLQDEIVRIMQRILKQMSQWESFVDVVNQLRAIIEMQDTVLEGTEGVRKKRIKGVFDD